MTKFEKLMNKSDMCEVRALKCKNPSMKAFWKNASLGYEIKALNLTVREASEDVNTVKGAILGVK